MTAVWVRARAELRAGRRSWLALALLLGMCGGVVIAASAGARRTASAFPRLLEATDAFDVLVNPNDGHMDFDAVERLPHVARSARGAGVAVLPTGPDGQPDVSGERFNFFASLDGVLGYTVDRPRIVAGRMPRRDRADEVLVDERSASDEGLELGSTLAVVTFSEAETMAFEGGGGPPPPGTPVRLVVVGIGTYPKDIPVAEGDRLRPTYLSPAIVGAYRPGRGYEATLVELHRGADDVAAFVDAAQRADGDEQVFYQARPELVAKAQRAVRPYWGALALFAVVGGLATMLIVGQALARQQFLDSTDYPTLAALGMTRGQLVAEAVVRVAAVGVVAATAATAVALALSPLAPIGLARQAEPDPGFWVDGRALGLGLLAIVALPMAVAAASAWRAAGASGRPALSEGGRRRPSLADVAGAAGLGPAAATGLRMALEPGRGRTAVPVRSTMAGTALSVAALAGALTFLASPDRLLTTPRLYGVSADAAIFTSDEDEEAGAQRAEEVADRLRSDPTVSGASVGALGQVTVAGVPVPAVALDPRKGVAGPTLVEGRFPSATDEVVLGATSLRRVDTGVGNTVEVRVGEEARPMRVVGRAVFPRFSAYPGADKGGLGDGVQLTVDGLRALEPRARVQFVLARFSDGVDPLPARARLAAESPSWQEGARSTTWR